MAERQLRLFVDPEYERKRNRLARLGYSSPKSADRFSHSLFWDEIRLEGEKIGLPARMFARDGDLRRAAYGWWVEDKGDRLRDAYIRQPISVRSGIVDGKRVKPPMRGYRKRVSSSANRTLILLGKRTPSMRFAVGDTQAHIPSYFRQLQRAKVKPQKGNR